MKSNTQNAKIEAITEKTLVLGIDVGSETHYARAFDYRGVEYSKKPFKFSNTEAGFVTFKAWVLDIKEKHGKDKVVLNKSIPPQVTVLKKVELKTQKKAPIFNKNG